MEYTCNKQQYRSQVIKKAAYWDDPRLYLLKRRSPHSVPHSEPCKGRPATGLRFPEDYCKMLMQPGHVTGLFMICEHFPCQQAAFLAILIFFHYGCRQVQGLPCTIKVQLSQMHTFSFLQSMKSAACLLISLVHFAVLGPGELNRLGQIFGWCKVAQQLDAMDGCWIIPTKDLICY